MYDSKTFSADQPREFIRKPPTKAFTVKAHEQGSKRSESAHTKVQIVSRPLFNNKIYPEGISKKSATRKIKYIPFVTIISIIIQVAFLGWAIYVGGFASLSENPYFGPPSSVK